MTNCTEPMHDHPDGCPACDPPPWESNMADEKMTDKELVDALCDIDDGLTEWEMNFVDSLAKWLLREPQLTERQRAKAEQIWAQKGD